MKLQEKEVSAYKAEHQNIAERLMREMPPVWWPRPMMNCASFSGSYAKNGTLQAAASKLLDSCDVDGVDYCVLKARHGRKEGRFTGREHGAWYLYYCRQPAPPGTAEGRCSGPSHALKERGAPT